jgi:hypothetical protein
LVEPQIERVTATNPVHEWRAPCQFEPKKVQAGFIQGQDDFAEQHVNLALALLDNRVESEQPQNAEQDRHEDEEPDERGARCDEEFNHGAPPQSHGALH